MIYLKKLILPLLMLLSFAAVHAQEEGGAGVGIAVLLLILVVGIAAITFWVWMLVDCIRKDVNNKAVWIIVMVLFGILGSIVYYFAVKRKG